MADVIANIRLLDANRSFVLVKIAPVDDIETAAILVTSNADYLLLFLVLDYENVV